ncbi:hypothetical protein GW930_02300 [Candidatus Saccharibacteria bacterium]|nr:hypothetical protein [Candidatus Saccharibacteria bacterium]
MDIVYLLKEDHENDSEALRYSLRSLKNIPHGKVFIAGEKPSWVKDVVYLPVEQSGTKPQNVKNNMHAAVGSDDLSDDFILMNDDFFFMKPIPRMPTVNFGFMRDVLESYRRRYPEGSEYIATMAELYAALRRRGVDDPISFELHAPMVFNKHKVRRLYQEVSERLYQFRTFYGNYFDVGGETIPDVKIFLDDKHNTPEYIADPTAYLQSLNFISVTGGAFNRGFPGDFVRSSFPEKCRYEV